MFFWLDDCFVWWADAFRFFSCWQIVLLLTKLLANRFSVMVTRKKVPPCSTFSQSIICQQKLNTGPTVQLDVQNPVQTRAESEGSLYLLFPNHLTILLFPILQFLNGLHKMMGQQSVPLETSNVHFCFKPVR